MFVFLRRTSPNVRYANVEVQIFLSEFLKDKCRFVLSHSLTPMQLYLIGQFIKKKGEFKVAFQFNG